MPTASHILTIFLVMAIPLLEILRRIIVLRKFKSMFPDRKPRFLPLLFDITLEQIPPSEECWKFIKFYKLSARIGLAIALICFFGIWVIGNLPNLYVGRTSI